MSAIARAARASGDYWFGWDSMDPYEQKHWIESQRRAFESIDVDELARALRRRAAYEGVVITDRQAQRIARDLRTYLLIGDESDE